MDSIVAIEALSALAQPTRLAAFRTLVRAYPDPVAAGVVALGCGAPHNTMSAHLAVLARAGLVTAERAGRAMLYRAAIGQLNALVLFLARDCCEGRPELCTAVAPAGAAAACCSPTAVQERADG